MWAIRRLTTQINCGIEPPDHFAGFSALSPNEPGRCRRRDCRITGDLDQLSPGDFGFGTGHRQAGHRRQFHDRCPVHAARATGGCCQRPDQSGDGAVAALDQRLLQADGAGRRIDHAQGAQCHRDGPVRYLSGVPALRGVERSPGRPASSSPMRPVCSGFSFGHRCMP